MTDLERIVTLRKKVGLIRTIRKLINPYHVVRDIFDEGNKLFAKIFSMNPGKRETYLFLSIVNQTHFQLNISGIYYQVANHFIIPS